MTAGWTPFLRLHLQARRRQRAVWFAWAVRDGGKERIETSHQQFAGDRELIRELAVAHALQGVIERAGT